MMLVVMGVSGCGKSTVAEALADRIGGVFVDADAYHPESNIRKMSRGIPLDDDDRRPWLDALNRRLRDESAQGRSVVLACSALKERYRDVLRAGLPELRFVYLEGTHDEVMVLLRRRKGHFMKPGMLASQFAALEPPTDAIRIPVLLPCEEQVRRIQEHISRCPDAAGDPGRGNPRRA